MVYSFWKVLYLLLFSKIYVQKMYNTKEIYGIGIIRCIFFIRVSVLAQITTFRLFIRYALFRADRQPVYGQSLSCPMPYQIRYRLATFGAYGPITRVTWFDRLWHKTIVYPVTLSHSILYILSKIGLLGLWYTFNFDFCTILSNSIWMIIFLKTICQE